MTVLLNPYLNFKGTARGAMTFYQSVFGGELRLSTFAEAGMPVEPSEADLIMHGMLEAPNGLVLMGADVPSHMEYKAPQGFAVSLSGDDQGTLEGFWDKLSEGATITMPLAKAPWGDHFGALADRFGIEWMVNITDASQAG